MDAQKHVERMRTAILAYTLPDTCKVRVPTGTPSVSSGGRLTWSHTYRQYNGSDNVPCRLDVSRAMRAETTEVQEVVATEYTLYAPFDMEIRPNDQIEFVDQWGRTRIFEIRKIADVSEWDAAIEATVTELDFQHGEPRQT